jgi:hypothetical protein
MHLLANQMKRLVDQPKHGEVNVLPSGRRLGRLEPVIVVFVAACAEVGGLAS